MYPDRRESTPLSPVIEKTSEQQSSCRQYWELLYSGLFVSTVARTNPEYISSKYCRLELWRSKVFSITDKREVLFLLQGYSRIFFDNIPLYSGGIMEYTNI